MTDWNKRLDAVARVYREAVMKGNGPTLAVESAFGISRSTAGSWIGRARAAGLLEGVGHKMRNKRCIAVADELGVTYEALEAAIIRHANGRLTIENDNPTFDSPAVS